MSAAYPSILGEAEAAALLRQLHVFSVGVGQRAGGETMAMSTAATGPRCLQENSQRKCLTSEVTSLSFKHPFRRRSLSVRSSVASPSATGSPALCAVPISGAHHFKTADSDAAGSGVAGVAWAAADVSGKGLTAGIAGAGASEASQTAAAAAGWGAGGGPCLPGSGGWWFAG